MLETKTAKTSERRTLTVPEAAKVLGLGINQAYDGVRNGEIPSLKVGGRWLIPRAALLKMLGEGDA